jgi:hypothetical protein
MFTAAEMKAKGYQRIGEKWIAPANIVEALEAEGRERLAESKLHYYQTVLGLTSEQAQEAIALENGSYQRGKAQLQEAGVLDGLTQSAEFIATRKVLEANGYSLASRVKKSPVVCFSKADCQDILVDGSGGWQLAQTSGDADPFTQMIAGSVTNGITANSLKIALISGVK